MSCTPTHEIATTCTPKMIKTFLVSILQWESAGCFCTSEGSVSCDNLRKTSFLLGDMTPTLFTSPASRRRPRLLLPLPSPAGWSIRLRRCQKRYHVSCMTVTTSLPVGSARTASRRRCATKSCGRRSNSLASPATPRLTTSRFWPPGTSPGAGRRSRRSMWRMWWGWKLAGCRRTPAR